MLDEILQLKDYLEKLKLTKPTMNKCYISTMLIVANMAESAIYCNDKIPETEKYYFDRQAAVGRIFSDWGEEYVADMYLKICTYIKQHHW